MIIGAICARGGSKGVARKALRLVGGVSLLERAVTCALACTELEKVFVSTDDEEIAARAQACGAEVPFLRPPCLALDDTPKWMVFRHLVENLEDDKALPVSVLVDLDVTVAMRSPEDVSGCLKLLRSQDVEVAVTAYRGRGNPYYNMVQIGPNRLAEIVIPHSTAIHDRQRAPDVFTLSPSVFAIRRETIALREHWSAARMAIHVVPRERAWDIDDEIDLHFVEFLFQHRQH